MLWPFMIPTPPKQDSIDRLMESDAWKETERQAAEAGKFWARCHKEAEPKVREAMIAEARIKYLHQGGKP